jgi:hypothetical protein
VTLLVVNALGAQNAQRGRPVVIFIHGRDQAFRDEASLRSAWIGAFQTGTHKIHAENLVSLGDIRFVYYGDVYSPDFTPSPQCIRAQSRGGQDAGISSELDSLWETASPVRGSLFDEVVKSVGQRLIESSPPIRQAVLSRLDDTRAYLEKRAQYCDTNLDLYTALNEARSAGRPIVLVAHSMGGLIAYTLLWSLDAASTQPFEIHRLVTVGSQLGLQPIVPYLIGQGARPPYVLPRSIHSWVNAEGRDDYLAWPVRGKFALRGTPLIEIEPRTEPGEPHGITGYLIHPWVATAIVRGWCTGFRPPARAPAACAGIQDVRDGLRSR